MENIILKTTEPPQEPTNNLEYIHSVGKNLERLKSKLEVFAQMKIDDSREIDLLVNNLKIIFAWALLLKDIELNSLNPKKLCIKYKQLDRKIVLQMRPSKICWKYVKAILDQYLSMCTEEFNSLFFELETSFGNMLQKSATSRLHLLNKITLQFNQWLTDGCLKNEEDILQYNEIDPDCLQLARTTQKKNIGNRKLLAAKYASMGNRLKTMNIAFNAANNSMVKAILFNFPLFSLANELAEIETRVFLASPKQSILATVWNLASVRSYNLVLKTSQNCSQNNDSKNYYTERPNFANVI